MKIEDQEAKLMQNIQFHRDNANKEAELTARKEEEKAAEEISLQKEETERRALVKKMSNSSDVSSIKNVLVNFEGIHYYNYSIIMSLILLPS